ncbi:hypothetical protein HaLaN_05045 [Haematococcus lacustris]|uniref:Uncharacterized protein n=1 Tax=Haematococcus lacustris TaxID=44745 RepID=A0A699YTV8_HAELA|nr:hypothetical protein HaLaN_05045 [Haematococcus lacustris]
MEVSCGTTICCSVCVSVCASTSWSRASVIGEAPAAVDRLINSWCARPFDYVDPSLGASRLGGRTSDSHWAVHNLTLLPPCQSCSRALLSLSLGILRASGKRICNALVVPFA